LIAEIQFLCLVREELELFFSRLSQSAVTASIRLRPFILMETWRHSAALTLLVVIGLGDALWHWEKILAVADVGGNGMRQGRESGI